MIYSIETSARILAAMAAAESGNNGYAFCYLSPDVAAAVRLAGYHAIPAAHPIGGRPCYRVFTPRGYAAAMAPGIN